MRTTGPVARAILAALDDARWQEQELSRVMETAPHRVNGGVARVGAYLRSRVERLYRISERIQERKKNATAS